MEVTDDKIDAMGGKNVNVTVSYDEVHLMKKKYISGIYTNSRPRQLKIVLGE